MAGEEPPARLVRPFGPYQFIQYTLPNGATHRVFMPRTLIDQLRAKTIPMHRSEVAPEYQFCWIWVGSLDNNETPVVWDRGTGWNVRRLFYALEYGPLPPRDILRNSCGNKRCLKPSHQVRVESGPIGRSVWTTQEQRDNNCCVHGHPLTEDNIYVTAQGKPQCRRCRTLAQQRYRERRRATSGYARG